jgi:hypothetical protein
MGWVQWREFPEAAEASLNGQGSPSASLRAGFRLRVRIRKANPHASLRKTELFMRDSWRSNQIKIRIKIKVKGSGQECPLHTSRLIGRVGLVHFPAALGWF